MFNSSREFKLTVFFLDNQNICIFKIYSSIITRIIKNIVSKIAVQILTFFHVIPKIILSYFIFNIKIALQSFSKSYIADGHRHLSFLNDTRRYIL